MAVPGVYSCAIYTGCEHAGYERPSLPTIQGTLRGYADVTFDNSVCQRI